MVNTIKTLAIVKTHYYGKDYIKSELIWSSNRIYVKLLETYYIDMYEDDEFDVENVYIENNKVYADLSLPMNRKDDIIGPIRIELGFNSVDLLRTGIIKCIEMNKSLPSKQVTTKSWWKLW